MKTYTDYASIPARAAYMGSEDGGGAMDEALADAIEQAGHPVRLRDDDGTCAYFDLAA